MSNTANDLTKRLLKALDSNYNVVDMRAISEVISVLENIHITKELLETTRLGKHVNELRRKTADVALARRAKLLVKRWRDLIIPDRAGVKVDAGSRQSPLTQQGISPAVTPAVTPRLCSPQVPVQGLGHSQKQGSLTASTGVMKPLQQHHQQHRRQPLTSPALQNISPALRNLSPGLRHLSQSPRNISPNLKNISPNLKNISPNLKISPGSKSSSPATKSLPQTAAAALRNLSPALRIPPDLLATNQVVTMVKDPYDSDSQDVIFVDDSADDTRVEPPLLEADRIAGINPAASSGRASKRPRSPLNGSLETALPAENEGSRKGAKRARREPGGRKAKKRRNHTKSENRTVDHSLDPPAMPSVGSPFLPISSASTSPALSTTGGLRNGINLKVSSPAPPVSIFADDVRSRSPKPEPQKARTSRKNGCKKPSNDTMMDDYSAFIKNKIPTSGKKVKTTKELLEEIQARKSGKPVVVEKEAKVPREDFLTAYDSKKQVKKDALVVSAIIELNDSNSSSKVVDVLPKDNKDGILKTDVAKEESSEPVKFEPLEVILAKLPPIDRAAAFGNDDFAPVCTCSVIYNTPVEEDKIPAPPKKSIFEMDYDDAAKDSVSAVEEDSSIIVPIIPTYEEKIDPYCKAAQAYHKRPADVTDSQIIVVHNSYVPGVNGTLNQKEPDTDAKPTLACQADEWGLRPFYDCSRDLFHTVVPRFRFLDYSLDGCLKNLARSNLDKYEPADAVSDSQSWFLELEDARLKTDEYQTIADSPFSEGLDRTGSSMSVKNIEINLSDIKDNNSQEGNVITISFDETANDAATNNNDPSFSKPGDADEGDDNYEDSNDDAMSRSSCEVIKKENFLDVDESSIKKENLMDVDESRDSSIDHSLHPVTEPAENVTPVTYKRPKRFTYSDSVTLLPLSLAALNASVGYFDSDTSDTNKGDLSCVFRTKDYTSRQSDSLSDNVNSLTYQSLSDTTVMELKDLNESSLDVLKRKRRDQLSFLVEHVNDDANCDSSDVGGSKPDAAAVGGAFDASQDRKCLGDGCPRWISKSDTFREWQQPVVRTSYNGDPLTVLPYVVID